MGIWEPNPAHVCESGIIVCVDVSQCLHNSEITKSYVGTPYQHDKLNVILIAVSSSVSIRTLSAY